ncbi:MAG TPA: diguanylate cyclase [Leptospiraceae bacterium]|nr:diguanylate cyclase [Spirochaetaceae bacterium]HBS05750.1 diguanylate cyclase [Leptospiraceae bacterium]|tara:strand:+ start:36492 stop:37817 length:1326 start_codon:yes stop_codon:yes gene_type:complete
MDSMEPTQGQQELDKPIDVTSNRLVFLISLDQELRNDLSDQLGNYGFDILPFPDLEAARVAMQAKVPLAMIADLSEAHDENPMTLAELKLFRHQAVPVLIVSNEDGFLSRLQAVRFGGDFYFQKPVDLFSIVEVLDRLTDSLMPDPYRVLVVTGPATNNPSVQALDDSPDVSIFRLKGPDHIFDALLEFDPELVLLDLYYPECLGMELSAVIRQQDGYGGLPILFQSTETDPIKKGAALKRGGDEILSSSIEPGDLYQSIALRVERYRTVISQTVRDSLTGLFNHTTTRKKLETEVMRCQKQNEMMGFAMIDIDKFKHVNDTYGHSAGDRVIQNLARLLKQRVRRNDIVGRYGGEEFAVIVTGMDRDSIKDRLEEIREDFSNVVHSYLNYQFQCTFSCGLTFYPDHPGAQELNDAADEAMYRAKSHGGNQVQFRLPSTAGQ